MAIEANGNICVAGQVDGEIVVVASDGPIIERMPTPDPKTTNVCFGGRELRTAFVTLAAHEKLIAIDWQRPGLGLHFLNH